jgi:WD40 repeat protein
MRNSRELEQATQNQSYNVIRVLKIFVSSPSDVATERQLIKKVVNQLNNIPFINEHVLLKLYAYEQDVPPATGQKPQMIIDQYMPTPDQVDIFICMFWNRMGTPFQDEQTGQSYRSGTEYEFIHAYQATLKTKRPMILLYRSVRPTDPGNLEPTQFAQVRAFFDRFSGNTPDFKGLYKSYSALEEFESVLFQDLTKIVRELIEADKTPLNLKSSSPAVHTEEQVEAFNRDNVKHISLQFMLEHHQKSVTDICFAFDQRRFISVSRDRTMVFYDTEHFRVDYMLGNLQPDIQAITYHPTSSLLAGINQRGEVLVWNTHTYQQERTLLSGERYPTDIIFSPQGMLLCAISRKGTGWCWQTDTWEMSRVICQFSDAARSLAFSSDGMYLAIACANGQLIVWDCQNWAQIIARSFSSEINVTQFIPNQPVLALGFEHGEIQLWDYKRSLLLASLLHHRERITNLIPLHDGTLLFSSSNDQRIVVWDVESRRSHFEIYTENDTPIALSLHPNETILAAGMASGRIFWYTVNKRKTK